MPVALEAGAFVIGAALLALPLLPRARRRETARDIAVVIAAAWLTDLAAVRVAGLHAYSASCLAAPLGVCLPVVLVRSALTAPDSSPGWRRPTGCTAGC